MFLQPAFCHHLDDFGATSCDEASSVLGDNVAEPSCSEGRKAESLLLRQGPSALVPCTRVCNHLKTSQTGGCFALLYCSLVELQAVQ
jgi:hypothetical protein